MPFYAPSWVPELPPVPDTVSIADFMLEDEYRPVPMARTRNFFTCGISGKTFTPAEVKERVYLLARGLGKEFGWSPNQRSEWDKVVGVFSVNTVSGIWQSTKNMELSDMQRFSDRHLHHRLGHPQTRRHLYPCKRCLLPSRTRASVARLRRKMRLHLPPTSADHT